MTKDEVLLFKIFDSDETTTRCSVHTGVEHPFEKEGRESIEVRLMCFWDVDSLEATVDVAHNLTEGDSFTTVGPGSKNAANMRK